MELGYCLVKVRWWKKVKVESGCYLCNGDVIGISPDSAAS